MTITVKEREENQADEPPERYSANSDDTLMNMLITKGYAFSREKGRTQVIEVDCGCNCNCCFGQLKTDFWELSKDCGCDCGCCNMNHTKSRQAPQFWIDEKGAKAAGRELVERNLHLTGAKLDDYMMMNFGVVWADYDVLGTGIIEIEQMSSFYKKLLKDFTMSI